MKLYLLIDSCDGESYSVVFISKEPIEPVGENQICVSTELVNMIECYWPTLDDLEYLQDDNFKIEEGEISYVNNIEEKDLPVDEEGCELVVTYKNGEIVKKLLYTVDGSYEYKNGKWENLE